MTRWQTSSSRYSNSPGGRLQVRPSRYYRIAWACLALLQLTALLLCLQRVSMPLSLLLVPVPLALLATCYRVPQEGEILRWRDGQWWLWRRGEWLGARLGRAIVLLPWLTGFTLFCDGPRHFLLFADGADRVDLHRIRVQLALQRSAER